MAFDPYASGVLQEKHHAGLVADLDSYAFDAGIQKHWICLPLPDDFPQAAREYLRQFRAQANAGVSGIVLTGENKFGRVESHMAAMSGAFVRNFIRARVMTLGTVIDMLPKNEMPELACLLIPNFFLSSADGGNVAPWQVSALFDYLTYRHITGVQTVLYATGLDALAKEYGSAFRSMIEAHYRQIQI